MCKGCAIKTVKTALKDAKAIEIAALKLGHRAYQREGSNLILVQIQEPRVDFSIDLSTGDLKYDEDFESPALQERIKELKLRAAIDQDIRLGISLGHTLISETVLENGDVELCFDDHPEQLTMQMTTG